MTSPSLVTVTPGCRSRRYWGRRDPVCPREGLAVDTVAPEGRHRLTSPRRRREHRARAAGRNTSGGWSSLPAARDALAVGIRRRLCRIVVVLAVEDQAGAAF